MAGVPYQEVSSVGNWRALLARGSLLAACSARLGRFDDLHAYASVRGAVSDLAQAAGVALVAPSDPVAVSEAATHWRTSIINWLENPGTKEPEERVLLQDIHDLCGAATAQDPFREIFDRVCVLAAVVYGDDWAGPTLELNVLPRHPRDPPDRYAILALTSAGPMVLLMIHPDGFGPVSFAALPSLFAHECFCHVPARQDRAKNDSCFAEGFMDWAARYFLERAIGRLLPDLSVAAKAHIGPFGEVFASPHTAEGRARRLGRSAADHLVRLAEAELGVLSVEAEAIVARVARDLNVHQALIAKKDLLVTQILALDRPDAMLAEVLSGTRPASDLI